MGRSYKLQNGGRGNDRQTRKKVSMEIMLKKTEGYVFNICLYHVSLKAFITNLEVVITISTNSLPTTYRQITNRRPTVGRQLADRSLPLWKNLSADSWPTVGGGELFFTFTAVLMGISPLKNAMKLLYLNELQEQSKGLCKKKDNPSVLRAGSQCYDPLVSFNWAKLLSGWKVRAPDVLDVATAIAVPDNNCLSQPRKTDAVVPPCVPLSVLF